MKRKGTSSFGLPQAALPVALLFFNAGVEVGQLCSVAAVFTYMALARQVSRHHSVTQPVWAWRISPYAIGSIAMFRPFNASPHFEQANQ
jgi:hypothetical protein